YLANATERGEQLHRGLVRLCERHAALQTPRGLGLMRAVDVVDPETGQPDHDLRDELVQAAFHKGLLLLGCGEHALRFCPPLCISAAQIDAALKLLDSVLAECTAAEVSV